MNLRIFLGLLIAGGLAPGARSRQDAPKPAAPKLILEVPSRSLQPGEPMMVRFTIENPGATEAELEEPVDFTEGLEIRDPETRIVKSVGKTKDVKRRWKVEGRGFVGRSVDISKVLNVPEDKEGFYTLKWQFGEATSNEIVVLVIRDYLATLRTTRGEITIEFYPDSAPYHVLHFVKLAREGKYNDTIFHRVIPNFMMQGGAMKEPPKPLRAEFNSRKHVLGTVSMARGNDPDSATCEFFICFAEVPGLNGKYTVFGNVVAGQDHVKEIENVKTDHSPCKQCRQDLPPRPTEHCGKHHEDKPEIDVILKSIVLTVRKK